jgi:hypothetical protein
MAIVWSCDLSVGVYAAQGKKVEVPRPSCPSCEALMIFWSGYLRPVRCGHEPDVSIFIRRALCKSCRSSHALLPSFLLVKRLYSVEVIGPVIEAVVAGAGTRSSARRAGVTHTTARGWCRRHRARAALAAGLFALLGARSALPTTATALSTLAPCGESLRWRTAALVSRGAWLSPLRQRHLPRSQNEQAGV